MLIRLVLALLFVPCAWAIHTSHLDLRRKVSQKVDVNRQVSLLPPEFIQLMAQGNDSLLADLLWLQMIQYYGTAAEEKLPPEHLYRYFDTITSLDPDFEAAYVFATYLLSDDDQQVVQSLKLLEKGEQNIPGSWTIPFQTGFVYYLRLKQPLKAAEAFERAGKKPGASDLPLRMAAQLYKKSNELERCQVGLRLWLAAYEQAPNQDLKARAERHIVESRIHCDLLLLRKALKNFSASRTLNWQKAVAEAKAKRLPPPKPPPAAPTSLQDLIRYGLLAELPKDPFGRAYLYRSYGMTVRVQPLPWKPIDLAPADVAS